MSLSKKLKKYINSDNIAENLDEDKLRKISEDCLRGLEEDKVSMKDWLDTADQAMELCELKRQEKNYPHRGASNVKFPLITTAAVQWTSRALQEFQINGKVASYQILGKDPSGRKQRQGERESSYLNHEIMEKMPNGVRGFDLLLQQCSVTGTCFTKEWYDPCIGMPRIDLIPYDQLVVNFRAQSLEEAPRISHFIYLSPNKLMEMIRYGLYKKPNDEIDLSKISLASGDMRAIDHELVEIHCWLDLDEDDYDEPYIVTIHKASALVLRIVARYDEDDVSFNKDGDIQKIKPYNYFTNYIFITSMDGSPLFGFGFGTLLNDINRVVNTNMNQLITAGNLACLQGGFAAKSLRIPKGENVVKPGEFLPVTSTDSATLKDSIVPFNYKEPSQVLFQLVQYLVESAQALTSTTDVMTGSSDTQNVSPNTMSMILSQGMKVYNAVVKRIAQSRKESLKKVVKLYSKYLDEEDYVRFIDPSPQEMMEMVDKKGQLTDFSSDSAVHIVPVTDMSDATVQEEVMKAQALAAYSQFMIQAGGMDAKEVSKILMKAMKYDDDTIARVIPKPAPPQPNPEMLKLQMQDKHHQDEVQLKATGLQMKGQLDQVKQQEMKAKTHKIITDAASTDTSAQMQVVNTKLQDQHQTMDEHLRNKEIDAGIVKAQIKAGTDMMGTASAHLLGAHKLKAETGKAVPKLFNTTQAKPQISAPVGSANRVSLLREASKRGFNPTYSKEQVQSEVNRRGGQV